MYLAVTAWVRKIDCVILAREDLLPFLGLERMKDRRIEWLKKDVQRLFPYAENLVAEKTKNYSSLYLSRIAFPDDEVFRWMSHDMRIRKLEAAGLKAAIVEIPEEGVMVSLMATAIHGIKLVPSELRQPAKS
jgi:hypothetical protein